jgi:hypothetical protein
MTKTEWRKARAEAFNAGAYKMRVPDPTTGNWDIVSWCNWVEFNDPALNGFDDRDRSERAMPILDYEFDEITGEPYNRSKT